MKFSKFEIVDETNKIVSLDNVYNVIKVDNNRYIISTNNTNNFILNIEKKGSKEKIILGDFLKFGTISKFEGGVAIIDSGTFLESNYNIIDSNLNFIIDIPIRYSNVFGGYYNNITHLKDNLFVATHKETDFTCYSCFEPMRYTIYDYLIDSTGKTLINAYQNERIIDYNNHTLLTKYKSGDILKLRKCIKDKDSDIYIIDKDKTIEFTSFAKIDDEKLAVESKKKVTIIDYDLNEYKNFYCDFNKFSGNYIDGYVVCENIMMYGYNKFGIADINGKIVVPVKYDEIGLSKNGSFYYKMDDCYVITNVNANNISMEYDYIKEIDFGKLLVVRDKKCGVVDYNNKELIHINYDQIEYKDNNYIVNAQDTILIYDSNFNLRNTIFTKSNVEFKFNDEIGMYMFYEKCENDINKYSIYDKNSNLIIEPFCAKSVFFLTNTLIIIDNSVYNIDKIKLKSCIKIESENDISTLEFKNTRKRDAYFQKLNREMKKSEKVKSKVKKII